MHDRRLRRRNVLSGAAALALLIVATPRRAAAQDELVLPVLGDVPSTGGRRPGPIRLSAVAGSAAPRGESPAAIQIPRAVVDAPVERVEIIDGVMQNPSGPWVVSWYHDLATLGRADNVVMAGHVDYWDVGPAVFWNLSQLAQGDTIEVVSNQDRRFTYAMEWMKNYVVADMTQADFDEMLGDAGGEALTLITCAIGSWDAAAQTYRERAVLRAMEV